MSKTTRNCKILEKVSFTSDSCFFLLVEKGESIFLIIFQKKEKNMSTYKVNEKNEKDFRI